MAADSTRGSSSGGTLSETTGGTTDQSTGTTEGPQTDSSSTGGPSLVDTGVIARWYIDEAGEGQEPGLLADSIAPPINLVLSYDGKSPVFDTDDGNRGLRWSDAADNGRASAPIAGSKIQTDFDGETEGTIELVLEVDDVQPQTSRFIDFGSAAQSDLAVGSNDLDLLEIRWADNRMYFETMYSGERQILHVVIDTNQARPSDRVVVYLDGAPLMVAPSPPLSTFPERGEAIPLEGTSSVTLGNREAGMRSFEGALRYAALYSTALTADDLDNNLMLLGDSDDE